MDYDVIGRGEPIVLLHGLGQTKDAWELQRELSNQFQLFIPTLEGHGTLGAFARDVVKMLDENGIDSAHFCGLSLGGVTAQEIYLQDSDRVKSMILANTTSYAPYFVAELAVQNRIASLSKLSDEQYITKTAYNALYNPTGEEVAQAIKTFTLNRKTYIKSARAIRGINYLPMLRTSTPIHIIASTHDVVTPFMYNALTMKLCAPRAEFTLLKNTGHLSNIQQPDKFNGIVRAFVGKQSEK